MLEPEANWRNLQFVRAYYQDHSRPLNNSKIHGADSAPGWAGNSANALDKSWRNLLGGGIRAVPSPGCRLGAEWGSRGNSSGRPFVGEPIRYLSRCSGRGVPIADEARGQRSLSVVYCRCTVRVILSQRRCGSVGSFRCGGSVHNAMVGPCEGELGEGKVVKSGGPIPLATPHEGRWAALVSRRP